MTTTRDVTKADPATPGPLNNPIPPDQLATPPASPPHLGGKQVQCTIGPHAGSVLTMPEGEADQAVADKWATAINAPPLDTNAAAPPSLSEAEQATALDAANTWAQAQVVPPPDQKTQPQHKPQAPLEEHRDMHAGEQSGGGYETRTPRRK